jgi:hypothetical protein
MIRTCDECGNDFETVLKAGPCGLRDCPSAGGGTGKPPSTTASGRPIDHRRVRSGAKRTTGGYVEQRSTGFPGIDSWLNRKRRR